MILVEDLGKLSVKLQCPRYHEAVAEGIAPLLNVCGMAALDYVSLPEWDNSKLALQAKDRVAGGQPG